jgi:Flp pilus assembly protein TadG
MRHRKDGGQAILLVLVALSLILIGGLGLAIDVSQMLAHRQMAQTAADAAAQAGIMSIFDHTNTGPSVTHPFDGSVPFTCATGTDSNAETPCVYARLNGFGTSDSDTVYVEFGVPTPGVQLTSVDPVNVIRVTITRTLQTGLIRFVGPSTSTIKATAVAAIVDVVNPIPILVLHPTLPDSYEGKGNFNITICGGPQKSIQVNSSSTSSISISGASGVVDLSHAGPDSTVTGGKTNCDGTGADFGDTGGPSTYPKGGLLTGEGRYIQPAAPIEDPLLGVPNPPMPGAAPAPTEVTAPNNGCPSGKCMLYQPGLYPSGITVKGEFALFSPGIYYITSDGFHAESNGIMQMAKGVPADPATGWTNNMMVFNTGSGSSDTFSMTANSGGDPPNNTYLIGSPLDSVYKGILFFEDHAVRANLVHDLQGGGTVSLTGTIYLTHTAAGITANGYYQRLQLGGTPGSGTEIDGMIIVDSLYLHGNPNITMKINPAYRLNIRQVALVR